MKVAVVQASTIMYDTPATMKKFAKLAEEAAKEGADLILFPVIKHQKLKNIILCGFCQKHRVPYRGPETGVPEAFFYSPKGYMGKHRKIVHTYMERIIWGQGDGSTMPVFDTELGKMGAIICHENYMTLYRVHLYSKGIQLYLAPNMDDLENWSSLMRAIAMEGRCFVITTTQYMKSSAYPIGHPVRKEHGDDKVFFQGGCCIIDPLGNFLVEPDRSGETIRYAEIDLSATIRGKFDLDTVGHYSRPDIFELTVNERALPGVVHKKCFVNTTIQYMKSSAYPIGHPVFSQGGCCIIDPLANLLVEPDRSGETIRYAEIDLSTTRKFDLDTLGHYSRTDIFELTVNERALHGVVHKK